MSTNRPSSEKVALVAVTPVWSSRWARPAVASQIRAVPSWLAVRTVRPSGANAAVVTQPRWPIRSSTKRPDSRSQSLALPSPLAVTSCPPSSLNERSLIGPVCPWSVRRSRPEAAAQTRTVPSKLPVAKSAPLSE